MMYEIQALFKDLAATSTFKALKIVRSNSSTFQVFQAPVQTLNIALKGLERYNSNYCHLLDLKQF